LNQKKQNLNITQKSLKMNQHGLFELDSLNQQFEDRNQYPLSKDCFKFLKLIGAGGFGKVYRVSSKFSRIHYAMKVLSKNQIKHYCLEEQLQREIEILNKCRHKYIVELHACFEDIR
jgi:serine/threonine protein kinase